MGLARAGTDRCSRRGDHVLADARRQAVPQRTRPDPRVAPRSRDARMDHVLVRGIRLERGDVRTFRGADRDPRPTLAVVDIRSLRVSRLPHHRIRAVGSPPATVRLRRRCSGEHGRRLARGSAYMHIALCTSTPLAAYLALLAGKRLVVARACLRVHHEWVPCPLE
jgi:hypothetical protein